jgi:hypothetical protein
LRKPLPAFPNECRRAEKQRRDYWFWRIRKPRAALGMVSGNEDRRGHVIKTSEVVFQFNDLRLRRGRSQQEIKALYVGNGKKCETTICNLGDLIPEVVLTSTCALKSRRAEAAGRKIRLGAK